MAASLAAPEPSRQLGNWPVRVHHGRRARIEIQHARIEASPLCNDSSSYERVGALVRMESGCAYALHKIWVLDTEGIGGRFLEESRAICDPSCAPTIDGGQNALTAAN